MSHSVLDTEDIHTSKYIITHVFCPPQLPDGNDHSIHNDHSLARMTVNAARLYSDYVNQANLAQWHIVSRMLENLQASIQVESLDESWVISLFSNMDVGDVLALPIRAQNAGVIFRKRKGITIYEAFELSPMAKDVMGAEGKLICSYPGPAIKIPNSVFDDSDFRSELANFLVHMNHDDLHTAALANREESICKDTVHPCYITELLTGVLRSVGCPVDIPRINKRIGDDVVQNNESRSPWRRSAIWLLIRVALQMTLDRSPLGPGTYKAFMLFLMCSLAREKAYAELPSDLLQFMSAKISRRLCKLSSPAPDWLSHIVLKTCTSLCSTIEDRWNRVQATQHQSPLWNPSHLDLAGDIQLSLLNTRDYICNALANHSIQLHETCFDPECRPQGTLDDFLSSDAEFFEGGYRVEPHATLYNVERAVEQDIDAWVARITDNDEACVKLEILAEKYSSSALKTYANNSELLSVMLLTTIELWVALDKIAVKEIPILADYSPEVPTSLLEHLLLCRSASLHRLRSAYEYLSRRHSQSRNQQSVFSSTITVDSFAVRFYRESPHLQRLRTRIEEVAWPEYRKKVAELWRKNARHVMLRIGDHHRRDMINVHEWPLPAQLWAEVVVFELDCPVTFNMWRAATFHLLVDLCSPSIERSDRPHIELSSYRALAAYFVKHPRSRISLGSNTRTSSLSHHLVSIPAKQGDVCINNRLEFFAFDTLTGVPVSQALSRVDNREHCTYKLQSGPYKNLQIYVDSTFHTSNEVIANQVDCHKDLSIREYIAFGHLRSGGLLQWANTLRDLRDRSLTFRNPEVHMLIAQAVSEVGPLANTGWTWHQEIEEPTFVSVFLRELEGLTRDVEANWKERVTMNTISFLLRRLLASSPSRAVTLKVLGLLRTVRGIVFSWVQELLAELVRTPTDEEFRWVLRDTAAICRSTFDVDPAITLNHPYPVEDIEVLLSCAMIIHDHMACAVSQLPAYSQLLLDRDRRLSLVLESVVNETIQADAGDQAINLAVGRIWPDYHPGSKWSPLGSTSYWFSCTTAPPAGRRPQVVHLNILDGSLLVDERPLGTWLPDEFMQHQLYRLIFGGQMLQVTPGDLPGMDYCTKDLISNHLVYFSLRNNDSDLVIRAKRKGTVTSDSGIMELIPHDKLEGDLPAVLIEGHVHWLNLSTSVMEIRALNSLWEDSSENWKIDCTPGHYHMRKGHEYLVDIRSQTWTTVSSLFRPLCMPRDLIISVSSFDSSQPTSRLQLSVCLSNYDLSFFVDEDGDLQSHNLRGMVYDENQSVGTLFGLVNQLVLRPKVKDINAPDLIFRCVLVPDGDVSFCMDRHHVRVEINPHRSGQKRIRYQTYKVNTDLGCLMGNAALTSILYRTYLHALTSGCGVDPLTSRSGTEEALSILGSANCWSATRLSPRDTELLSLIASLCPLRTWYSKRSVQKVEWRKLSPSSQNHGLYFLSKAIKDHYERLQQVHEGSPNHSFEEFPLQDDHLFRRGAQQAVYLFPFKFPEKPSGANLAVRYPAIRVEKVAAGERRAHTAATYVYLRNAAGVMDVWKVVESWKKNMSRDTALSLRYHRSWIAPDLPLVWLKAYDLLRNSNERKWFQLLFSLSAMAYSSPKHRKMVPVFVAFALHSAFNFEDPPHYDTYPIPEGFQPSRATLHRHIVDCAQPLERSPEYWERRRFGENDDQVQRRRRETYDKRVQSDADAAVQRLLQAWPCETPPPCPLDPHLYDVGRVEFTTQRLFSNLFRNLKLKEHFTRIQTILNDVCNCASPNTIPYFFDPPDKIPSCAPWRSTVDKLFARPTPPLQELHTKLAGYAADSGNTSHESHPDSNSLYQLIATVGEHAVNPFQREYVSALRSSADSFRSEIPLVYHRTKALPTAQTLLEYYARCRASYTEMLHRIQQHLGPGSQSEQMLQLSGQWPRITTHTLFAFLASNSPVTLPNDWKRCIIMFVLTALELQRARRLFLLRFDNLYEELWRELQNEGCDGWNPEAHPDWLLIQLQGNLLIRRVQAEVADEMISPSSGENTAMQLNMGEGKTSVILPIVAAALANGDQLVRIIVPKPLTVQTLHLLVDRLGGLANRRVIYLPFSRSLELNEQKLASFSAIMLECMQERGILVVQPEHVLSLKLVSVEKQLVSRNENYLVADSFLRIQMWLHSHCRDVLDESDEILDVRSQLVFTIGQQQNVEGSPERWTTAEQVLSLAGKHASNVRELFPLGVEYELGPPGSFPHLRVLERNAGKMLTSLISQDVVEGHLANFSLGHHFHSGLKDSVRSFISNEDAGPTDVQLVKKHFGQTSLWGGLLLLRGLLANNVLLSAFKDRRWRVDYGLSPMRTMLAVPYRAKDVPAQRAEFGHPDMAIILTYLSYYYSGLSTEQLRASFGILFKQHDPSINYDLWLRVCPEVPKFLQTISCVNIESVEQWDMFLFPLFSRNRETINFYLSHVVFPREAKEFPLKLSSSGWDLAEKKQRLLTGFSGTNDSQYLLPLHITQRDPDHQRGTNAKVLSNLLQPENNRYMCMTPDGGQRRTIHEFLGILVAQKPEIRVLLDVGAQMLDLHNHKLAEAWLDMTPNASAAIYFNESDELTVRSRDGSTQLLLSSQYAEQLERCIIYLDDAHTRGTDIKFPIGFRAAVTLGPKVTKDRLAQGCMRMRMLGRGHSIMFFAPLVVDQRIRSVAGKETDSANAIDIMDILHLAIRETWENARRWAPHWVQQGLDHTSRYSAWTTFCEARLTSEKLSNNWLQREAKSLKDLYEPRDPFDFALLAETNPRIYKHCINLGVLSLWSVGMDEEQEREVVFEVIREQQVERQPRRVSPATHSIRQDVVDFVKTGVISTRTNFSGAQIRAFSSAFIPAFETLGGTSAASDEVFIWGQSVLVTADFKQTIKESEGIDDFLRPVHWIVSAKRASGDVFVVLSPYEANSLLPDIRSSNKVHLHLYTPRITKSMKQDNDLALYSIPTIPNGWISSSSLMDQLNVFSGQLYLKDYETYIRLCRFLCVYAKDLEGENTIVVEPDGFILPKNRKQLVRSRPESGHTFASTPLVAIKALVSLRSKGVDFSSTHMGKIVHGRPLSKDDFDSEIL